MREATVQRKTKETGIEVRVNLDGTGVYDVKTGIGFLDHMLEQLARHSLLDLYVRATGDLHIAFHPPPGDPGIPIAQAQLVLRYEAYNSAAFLVVPPGTPDFATISFHSRSRRCWASSSQPST